MDRLIVKNFGPLKDVDITINRVNLFIGENGSGKSVLAKLITIIFDVLKTSSSEDKFLQKFIYYDINYLSNDTEIKLISNKDILLEYKNSDIKISKQLKEFFNNYQLLEDALEQIELLKESNSQNIEKLKAIKNDKNNSNFAEEIKKLEEDIKEHKKNIEGHQKKVKNLKNTFLKFSTNYIPAERNLVSLFNKALSSLIVADIPLPKFLLQFSSDFQKASNSINSLEFLNVKYISGGSEGHKIYFNKDSYLPLENSSSGIQSALPLYLTVKYFSNKHGYIVIEEPEQNLFPKAQKETIEFIVGQNNQNSIFMMTHSPYILSTLNILLFAYKIAHINNELKNRVKEIVGEDKWINPDKFSAYYLENGIARDIKSKRGLISDNEIDEISEDIAEEFDILMEIYREYKHAKKD